MQKVKKVLPFVAAGMALLAIIFLALPAGEATLLGLTGKASGFKIIFGGDLVFDAAGERFDLELDFSFVNFLAFLFLIGGAVMAVIGVKMENKVFKIVSGALFLVAAILFFCVIENLQLDTTVFDSKADAELMKDMIKEYSSLGAGAILPAVCSILAGAAILVPAFLPDEK
ncbi:MAG: hypothetical protein IJY21_04535 [Clostridia bacterium]|nr:hypothetical protein [Clostridia bacterium]